MRVPRSRWLIWAVLPLLGCGAGLQADDAETQALLTRARELYDAEQYDLAREKAGLAVQRAEDSAAGFYLRGLAQLRLGRADEAKNDLTRAKQLDPLMLFAPNKAEFEVAWKQILQAVPETSEPVQTPPAGEPPPAPSAADQPADKPAEPSGPTDPAVEAVRPDGPQAADISGGNVLGPPQLKAIAEGTRPAAELGVTPKIIVIPAVPEPSAEAKRLHEAAALKPDDLVVVGDPAGALGAFSPLLLPEDVQPAVDAAKAVPEASLARRLIHLTNGLAKKVRRPAATIPTPTVPTPTVPTPRPEAAPVNLPLIVGGSVIGLVVLLVVVSRVRLGRRLNRGFQAARPRFDAVAARLTETAGLLGQRPDRAAKREVEAAELAYFDALAMLADADANDTGDIARVERAVRLLDEADAKLTAAGSTLATAPASADGPVAYCWFTARPIYDRFDGDLVRLQHGDREQLVLAARQLEGVFRRGGAPPVRSVNGRHWATVDGFEPAVDFYSPRLGRDALPAAKLIEPLPATPRWPVYVDHPERPDYTVDLSRLTEE